MSRPIIMIEPPKQSSNLPNTSRTSRDSLLNYFCSAYIFILFAQWSPEHPTTSQNEPLICMLSQPYIIIIIIFIIIILLIIIIMIMIIIIMIIIMIIIIIIIIILPLRGMTH